MLRCAVPLRVAVGGELVHTHWLAQIVRKYTQVPDIRDNAPQYEGCLRKSSIVLQGYVLPQF